MNLILFNNTQITDGCFVVTGNRYRHLIDVLKVKVNSRVRVGQVNGKIGYGIVEEILADGVIIRPEALTSDSPDAIVDLILALPRPQMLKRVLENCPTLGVNRLYLIRSGRVEKSYFSSPLLQDEDIRERLWIGAEQAVVTKIPEVIICDRFRAFTEEYLDRIVDSMLMKLIAHPGGLNIVEICSGEKVFPAAVAVGPEGGWLDHEVEVFEKKGFSRISLGPRVLRVETAVYSVLANLAALYQYRQKSGF